MEQSRNQCCRAGGLGRNPIDPLACWVSVEALHGFDGVGGPFQRQAFGGGLAGGEDIERDRLALRASQGGAGFVDLGG